jgi:hypothetical protein
MNLKVSPRVIKNGYTNPCLLVPASPQDFEQALREVSPSVDPESETVRQLSEWNKQYGTTANKGGVRAQRLSYFT